MNKFLKVQQKHWFWGRHLFFGISIMFFGLFSYFRVQTNVDFRNKELHLPIASESFESPSLRNQDKQSLTLFTQKPSRSRGPVLEKTEPLLKDFPSQIENLGETSFWDKRLLALEGVSIQSAAKNPEKNHKILLGLGSAVHLQDSWSLSPNGQESSVTQEKSFSDCKENLEKCQENLAKSISELTALPTDPQCNEKIDLFYTRAGKFFLDFLYKFNPQMMINRKVQEVTFTDFSSVRGDKEIYSGLTLRVINQKGELDNIHVKKQNLPRLLPNLINPLRETQLLINSFQENKSLLEQQIQNNTELMTLKNKFQDGLNLLNSLQLSTRQTGELNPRLDRAYLPLNFQMYVTPFPKIGLSGSCSANLRRGDVSFGLGKAGFKPLSSKSSSFGVIYGGSCDMMFQPRNGSSFKYSYGGLCFNTFIGLGLRF